MSHFGQPGAIVLIRLTVCSAARNEKTTPFQLFVQNGAGYNNAGERRRTRVGDLNFVLNRIARGHTADGVRNDECLTDVNQEILCVVQSQSGGGSFRHRSFQWRRTSDTVAMHSMRRTDVSENLRSFT